MSVEGAVLWRLENFTALTNLISTRSYAVRLPQHVVMPALVYQRISAVREHAMGSDPGIVTTRWQFTVYAETFEGCKDVSDQVLAAFRRWRDTQDSTQVDDTFPADERDGFEADVGDDGLYRSRVDIMVHHRE